MPKVEPGRTDSSRVSSLSMKALIERPAGMPERDPREPREYRERAPRQPRENREYREPRADQQDTPDQA